MKTARSARIPEESPDSDFRLLLQAELARRCSSNPQYSLRAFALALETDHSSLSQILRGRRALTESTIRRLGARLGLEERAIERYCDNERLFAARRWGPGADQVVQLARDTAELVADWHHHAILELLHLDGFRADSRWIARVLGLSVDEVDIALHRLIRVGLLEMRAAGEWVDLSGDSGAGFEDFSATAVQRLSEQVRRLSLSAARTAPPELREHSSTTLAVDSSRLPAAIECIARFRRELLAVLDGGSGRDDVYRLEIHLFPVTRIQQERRP